MNERKDYHDMMVQIPNVVWDRIGEEADATGVSITKLVTEVFRARYDIPAEDLPKPKRTGRKPARKAARR